MSVLQTSFFVHGKPLALGRPRAYKRGNFIGMYDDPKSKPWKETVKWQAIACKAEKLEGPLKMILDFYLPRPKDGTFGRARR